MSDRERFLARLEEVGSKGLHSHEARREGLTGHPSERARELEAEGHPIRREREFINGRNGVRFYLESVGITAGDTPMGSARHRSDLSAPCGDSSVPQLFAPGIPTEEPGRPLSAFTDAEAA